MNNTNESDGQFVLLQKSDLNRLLQMSLDLQKIKSALAETRHATGQAMMPLLKFCREYQITNATVYKYNSQGMGILKKLGKKTFVDVKKFESLMKDYESPK